MFWLISGIGETAKNTAAGITATEGAILEHDHGQQARSAKPRGSRWNGAAAWLIFSRQVITSTAFVGIQQLHGSLRIRFSTDLRETGIPDPRCQGGRAFLI
jgi:hypothetical protein